MDNRPNPVARLWPFGMAALVVGVDRLTKILISRRLSPVDAIPVVPEWLRIIHTENTGAAFGILADGNPVLRAVILLGVSGLVLLVVALALWKRSSADSGLLTRLGLAFVLGGAAGNLYDRVVYGSVTDFIEVYHGLWSFPAFNVADSAITVGAAFLVLDQLRGGRTTGKSLAARARVNRSS